MGIHNSILFRDCRNYNDDNDRVEIRGSSTKVPEVVDNNYTTFSDEDDMDVDVSEGSDATRIQAVFLKYTGAMGYTATPSGGSGSAFTRTLPNTVENASGDDVSVVLNGLKNDLYLLSGSGVTATSVRFEFSGTNIRIYALMCLEIGLEFNANAYDVTDIQPFKVDRAGRLIEQQGSTRRIVPIGNVREKWEVNFRVKIVPGRSIIESVDEFLYWKEANKNCVFAQEFSRYPDRVYPATFPDLSVEVPPRGNYKGLGDHVVFRVWER